MNSELINKTEEFLKAKFDSGLYLNAHPDAKAYRLEHSYRVANIGKQIAEEEGFDVYRIHEILANDGFIEKDHEDKLSYSEARLEKLRSFRELPMATRAAEKMWLSRLDFYISFFEKLVDQLKCSKSILE